MDLEEFLIEKNVIGNHAQNSIYDDSNEDFEV